MAFVGFGVPQIIRILLLRCAFGGDGNNVGTLSTSSQVPTGLNQQFLEMYSRGREGRLGIDRLSASEHYRQMSPNWIIIGFMGNFRQLLIKCSIVNMGYHSSTTTSLNDIQTSFNSPSHCTRVYDIRFKGSITKDLLTFKSQ